MGFILPVNGILPQLGADCFVAPNATITGDVVCGDRCSFWFNSVVRGDVHQIRIGDNTNIQDGAVIHCTYQRASVTIGNSVTIGHQAMVHGCTIEDEVLIGMGAIILDHAVVGKGCIVAAGGVVLEKMVLEPGYLYAGIPAQKIKPVSELQSEAIRQTATNYTRYASWYNL